MTLKELVELIKEWKETKSISTAREVLEELSKYVK